MCTGGLASGVEEARLRERMPAVARMGAAKMGRSTGFRVYAHVWFSVYFLLLLCAVSFAFDLFDERQTDCPGLKEVRDVASGVRLTWVLSVVGLCLQWPLLQVSGYSPSVSVLVPFGLWDSPEISSSARAEMCGSSCQKALWLGGARGWSGEVWGEEVLSSCAWVSVFGPS